MVVALCQQYNVGEKPTVILYTYVNRHAGTRNKTKTEYTMSLDNSLICCIGSRIGWVSMKEIFMYFYSFQCGTPQINLASTIESREARKW